MIKTSDQINELATALALAQGLIEPADKDGKSHQAKYATLLSVRESSRSALSKNDLCLVQAPVFENGRIGIITRIIHKSGQWIESTISIKLMKDDPHSLGSAITYGRRYAMSSMLGIVADIDDDGEAAMDTSKKKKSDQSYSHQSYPSQLDSNPSYAQVSPLDQTNHSYLPPAQPSKETFIFNANVEKQRNQMLNKLAGEFRLGEQPAMLFMEKFHGKSMSLFEESIKNFLTNEGV